MTVVLDSWPVMRYLANDQPVATKVHQLLEAQHPIMSWINLGEVLYVLTRAVGESEAKTAVRDLQARISAELPTVSRIEEAALIKASLPMSYADAFAAATAIARNAELWTGDPELLVQGSAWRWVDLR